MTASKLAAALQVAALEYAELLGPVFPRPVPGVGLDQATRNPDVLRIMWRPWVSEIALDCARAGVLVLDVDIKGANGFAALDVLEATYAALPHTWRASTPSGGAHLYFAHPPHTVRNRTGFRPGLDCKATRGSITLPPSVKPSGAYAWQVHPMDCTLAEVPPWLVALIAPPEPPPRPPRPIRRGSLDRTARYVAAVVNAECAELARTRAGRNTRLFQASANLGELVGGGLLPIDMAEHALEQAAVECGLIGEDGWRAVRASIASGLRRGMAKPRGLAA